MTDGERESSGPRIPVSLSLTPKRPESTAARAEEPTFGEGGPAGQTALRDDEIEPRLLDVLESVRAAIQADGGDIVYKGIRNGVVRLQLLNCHTCLVPDLSVKEGLERILKTRVDGVSEVEIA